MATKTYELTPEQAYQLMIAALDVVGGISGGVHARIRRAVDTGKGTSYPTVPYERIVRLVDTLNTISPGIADRVIMQEEAQRIESKARAGR